MSGSFLIEKELLGKHRNSDTLVDGEPLFIFFGFGQTLVLRFPYSFSSILDVFH